MTLFYKNINTVKLYPKTDFVHIHQQYSLVEHICYLDLEKPDISAEMVLLLYCCLVVSLFCFTVKYSNMNLQRE